MVLLQTFSNYKSPASDQCKYHFAPRLAVQLLYVYILHNINENINEKSERRFFFSLLNLEITL